MKYNSSKFSVENLFRSGKLSQLQIDKIVKILNVLAKYMFIDRDILNSRAGGKIGLSHIQRAIDYNLIVELKDFNAINSKTDIDGNHYFYSLGLAGINFLNLCNEQFYSFKLNASFEDKEKVLIMNYNALERGYDLLFSDYNDMLHYNFFHCKNKKNENIILYFEDYIAESHIKAIIKRKFIDSLSDEEYENRHELFDSYITKYKFETIKLVQTCFNNNINTRISTTIEHFNLEGLRKSRYNTES